MRRQTVGRLVCAEVEHFKQLFVLNVFEEVLDFRVVGPILGGSLLEGLQNARAEVV